MNRKQEQKEETRQRMLAAAGRNFRAHGYNGIGVDGIAKDAGVTSGAFYAHFGSKDGAFSAALDSGLDEVIEGIPNYQRDHGAQWVQAFSDYYLGRAHRDDLAGGCAMTSLSSEVVRAGRKTHAAYEVKMEKIVGLISGGLAGGSDDDRRARAWAMLGTLIGGLTVARAVKGAKLAEEVATSIRNAAVKAAGKARRVD